MFAMVVIMNAFNLIDGVDGLAGGIGLLTSAIFGIYFFLNGNIPYAVMGIGFAASLLAFLHYNFHPAKIFMGDTGSLMLGLVNSILVVKFVETAHTYTQYPLTAAPAIGFGIMLLPLMDTLRVFGMRISKGKSPFSPDRNHIHHLLLDRGFNHRGVTLTCMAATAIVASLSFYFQSIGTTFLIAGLICLFFGWVTVLYFKRSRYKLRVIKGEADKKSSLEEQKTSVRLVSLFTKKAATVDEE
jgi:UDP-N-acetylmuramyl pentapeptide phosphotransferase/UDP-N-acetylglucosamine-1-phosphate transferase